MTDIGFIGLGNMGAALARRLMRDHTLHVWDLNQSAVDDLVADGAIAATVSSQDISYLLRSTGTCQSASTFSFAAVVVGKEIQVAAAFTSLWKTI